MGRVHRFCASAAAVLGLVFSLISGEAAARDYWLFESGPVRPVALSPDGTRLFVTNVPDNRLEVFAVSAAGLTPVASVPVGLEPVSVAARTNTEVWVVNHLSDSVSVLDVGANPPRVTHTLLVGDEPRDIVFAGARLDPNDPFPRAFITTAHRGQTHDGDPNVPKYGDFLTPGTGRADVWVFDAGSLGASDGSPETILTLFGDTPRALAASADGTTVFAAVFHSGNKTTAVLQGTLPQLPPFTADGVTAPGVGHILGFDGVQWLDQLGAPVAAGTVQFALPDFDIFEIDADAPSPVEVVAGRRSGVGTILFNMVIDPTSQRLYVTNTEANNRARFEGPSGDVTGHIHEARITVIDGASVLPRHLNHHINYATVPSAPGTKERSLSVPTALEIGSDRSIYVAAFGSAKIGIFDADEIDANTFDPNAADHVTLSGGGPSGLALDEGRGRLYVYTRFDNAMKIVDLVGRTEIASLALHNPEPANVTDGRPFLYDAQLTSSNGEASCATCHVFGDFDSLAWDLGDPDGSVITNLNDFRVGFASQAFHPLKGPMTTQTLRGMADHGPMHWRGDRSGANDPNSLEPLDEEAGFKAFNVAFAGLVGRSGPLSVPEMQAFTDFALQMVMPPNPLRNLDNTESAAEGFGRAFYETQTSDIVQTCNGCHVIDEPNGFFGGDGFSSIEGETQEFKIPHMRNLYQKVGMFNDGPNTPQVRGFGYLHDGSVDTVLNFLRSPVFQFPGGDPQRTDVVEFLLASPTTLAPIVGQQATIVSPLTGPLDDRVTLLTTRAGTSFMLVNEPLANECDLVAKATVGGAMRGWLWNPGTGEFDPDALGDPSRTTAGMLSLGTPVTLTCVPPGSGPRVGVDRDLDGTLDADDTCPATGGAQTDGDGDTIGDLCDNCATEPNTGQADGGGVGDASLADGIGDVCQCGELDGDGTVGAADADALAAFLADPIGSPLGAAAGRCSVIGGAADCDIVDWVVSRRANAGLAPGASQVCTAAL